MIIGNSTMWYHYYGYIRKYSGIFYSNPHLELNNAMLYN